MTCEQPLEPTNTILKKKKKLEDPGIDPGTFLVHAKHALYHVS